MQQIERYGVIALVFLLVTIVVISFWGDSKSPGLWSRIAGKKKPATAEVVVATPALPDHLQNPDLPLANPPADPIAQVPSVGGVPEPTVVSVGNGVGTLSAPGSVVVPEVSGGVPPAQPGGTLVPSGPGSAFPPATGPLAPAAGAKYVVKNGDTLERIARRELGAGNRWSEIQALNPGVDPKSLRIGTELALPAGARPSTASEATAQQPAQKPTQKPAQPVAGAPAKSGGRNYTVQRGDTLSSIAARQLGDSNRWKDIQAVNPGLDPNRLRVGDALRLPQIAGGAQVARAETAAPAASRKGRVQ